MHESAEDLDRLQRLLDDSYARAGPHLLSIHTPDWRMSANQVVEALTGMCVLSLATVSSRCEPVVAPVDGLFFRGRLWFGSSPDSMRAKHIRARPQVSAAHVRGEDLAVVVHGEAREVADKQSEMALGFRAYVAEIYGEQMGEEGWASALYWWIEPRRMFALAPMVGSEATPSAD